MADFLSDWVDLELRVGRICMQLSWPATRPGALKLDLLGHTRFAETRSGT